MLLHAWWDYAMLGFIGSLFFKYTWEYRDFHFQPKRKEYMSIITKL